MASWKVERTGAGTLKDGEDEHRRLSKIQALAAFSPDALASIGYADQEIYLGLVIAGSLGLVYALPIALAITGLLAVLALSYYQIVQKYPSGGGSYEVARTTLGTVPGLMAAGRPNRQLLAERSSESDNGRGRYCISFPRAVVIQSHPVTFAAGRHNPVELTRNAGEWHCYGDSSLLILICVFAHARIRWSATFFLRALAH